MKQKGFHTNIDSHQKASSFTRYMQTLRISEGTQFTPLVLGFPFKLHLFVDRSFSLGQREVEKMALTLWLRNGLSSSSDAVIRKTSDNLLSHGRPIPSALMRTIW